MQRPSYWNRNREADEKITFITFGYGNLIMTSGKKKAKKNDELFIFG